MTYTQTFDAENRLISVTVNGHDTTQFIYDGDGNLVKKIKPDGSKTIYVGGLYEVDKSSGGSVTKTTVYYPAGNAIRVNGTLYYILKDHLGSTNTITDASGNIVGENRYYPFGETRLSEGSILTDRLFTGQRELADLGIYHYSARMYSPALGRFLSADNIVPDSANPQDFNRFSYVRNNPLKYTDPTGHWLTPNDQGEGGSIPPAQPPVPPSPPPGNSTGGNTDGKPNDKNSPAPVPSNSPPDTGPIFEPLPDPIIDIGPIIIIPPINLPDSEETSACVSLKNKVTRLSAEVSAIIQRLDKLSKELGKTTDPEKRKAIQKQMDNLTAERDDLLEEIGKLYFFGQALGCDVNNW